MSSVGIPPRLSRSALADAQTEWENREVLHAIVAMQFANGAAVRVASVFERHVLDRVTSEVARRIDNIPRGRRFLVHRRARFLIDAIRQIVKTGSEKARKALLAEARDLAATEVRWLARTGDQVLGAQFSTPAPSVVQAAITGQPMLGRPFGEWFRDWIPRQTEARVVARVRAGMLAGETTSQIVRGLQGTRMAGYTNGELARSRHALVGLTHTVLTHTSTIARDLTFRANADVVTRVRWLSVLDLRTTKRCAELDGTSWPTESDHPAPPIHFRCRSSLIPDIGPRLGKRASLGGRVDATVDYEEWLRTRSPREQDMVLGRAMGAAWRAGKITLRDMVDATYRREITLRELRRAGKL